jgi:uncharacterized repeat protein (TIGR04076 family)
MPQVKITVVKTTFHRDLVDRYLKNETLKGEFGPCPIFTEGQTFVSEDWPAKPDGFCERAWPNIQHEVAMVMYEATIPWIEDPGYTITCCNDGLRPVIFKVERVSEH